MQTISETPRHQLSQPTFGTRGNMGRVDGTAGIFDYYREFTWAQLQTDHCPSLRWRTEDLGKPLAAKLLDRETEPAGFLRGNPVGQRQPLDCGAGGYDRVDTVDSRAE